MKSKQISLPSPPPRQLFMDWYHSTPAGKALRDGEASYLLNCIQDTFYQKILQVGRLGMEFEYIREEYRRNFALIAAEADVLAAPGPNTIRGRIEEWPIACESVDTLILPHLIEFEADPHRVLSEAWRVLKPEGRLFILGFNPWSIRGLLPRQQSPSAWNTGFIGCQQVIEWLNLLKFECEFSAGFGLFSSRALIEPQSVWQKSMARLTSAYALKAIKRTWTAIPVKQVWVQTASLVPGQAMAPPLMRKLR